MIEQLILTLVVLCCLGLVMYYALPPIGNALVQWAIRAIIVLIAVLFIARIWGLGV